MPAYFGEAVLQRSRKTVTAQRRYRSKAIGGSSKHYSSSLGQCMNTCIARGGLRRPGRGQTIEIPESQTQRFKPRSKARKVRFLAAIHKLYIILGKRTGATIRQLGYPTKNAIKSWHREYEQGGNFRVGHVRSISKYSAAQKKVAVEHYLNHDRFLAGTRKALGYQVRIHVFS